MYKVVDGQIIERILPTTGVLKDGSMVSNYNMLPQEVLLDEGWLPLHTTAVEQPENTTLVGYDENVFEDHVVRTPIYEPIPPAPINHVENALKEVATVFITEKIQSDELTNDLAVKIRALFPLLDLNGDSVVEGEIYQWEETLVEIVQSHTTQTDWTPEVSPSLFKLYRDPSSGPHPWVQPLGGHDAYSEGAIVTHNGQTWLNTYGDGNVWEPGVFGWTVE